LRSRAALLALLSGGRRIGWTALARPCGRWVAGKQPEIGIYATNQGDAKKNRVI
jgi:hypothetical protein